MLASPNLPRGLTPFSSNTLRKKQMVCMAIVDRTRRFVAALSDSSDMRTSLKLFSASTPYEARELWHCWHGNGLFDQPLHLNPALLLGFSTFRSFSRSPRGHRVAGAHTRVSQSSGATVRGGDWLSKCSLNFARVDQCLTEPHLLGCSGSISSATQLRIGH